MLNQLNLVHSLTPCFCEININIIFLSMTVSKLISSLQGFQTKFSLAPSFSWDVARCRLVVPYRRFGTTYRSQLQGTSSPLELLDYQPTPHNITEVRRPPTTLRWKPAISQNFVRISHMSSSCYMPVLSVHFIS